MNQKNTELQDPQIIQNPEDFDIKLFVKKLFHDKAELYKYLPAILLIVSILVVYIGIVNSHIKKHKHVQELKEQNEELRSELISLQTKLMTQSKQSQVYSQLRHTGLQENRKPPFKIVKPKK
jgi:hypothetical protein